MPTLFKTLLLCVLLSLSMAPTVDAQSGNGISKNKAVKMATAKYPGKVVKITGSSKTYQVRVLQKNGRVITVKVDKTTGKILNPRKKGR